jgi:class 3 adenylate cyclase/pimeloyl-ACP methyl ester carboxylesterase
MASTQTVTILFCDLVASTDRRARLGDDAFDAFTGRFMDALRRAVADNDGREVKSAGDGLMVVFPRSVADAVVCAGAMHRCVAELDPHDPPLLRVGISTGEVAEDGDDFSGMPIVEAARLEAAAEPGKTLANAVVRTLVGTRRAFRFRDVGALTLKGIPMPLSTVEVLDDQVLDAAPPITRSSTTSPPAASATARWRRPRSVLMVAAIVVVAVAVAVVVSRSMSHSNSSVAASPPAGITAPKGYVPRYVTTRCPSSVTSVASNANCGLLLVPQDRAKPAGRQVRLLVTSAPPRLSGPSVAPTIDVCGCENLGSSLARDHSELIHVAQRGFVDSDPELTCPEMSAAQISSLASRALDPTEIARGTDAMRRCRARLVAAGVDPAQYNYDTAAHDLLDLMYALHIQRADFVAFEGADAEVFDVLRQAPSAVRSITLDNPPPAGTTALSDPIGDFAGAWGRYVALCDRDPICAHAYPDLAQALQVGSRAFDAHPLLVTTPNPNGANLPAVRVLLDAPRTADALANALRDPNTYPVIPAAIEATDKNSAETIIASVVVQAEYPSPNAPWGAAASYNCAYDVNTQDLQGEALEAHTLPQFVRAISAQWTAWCKTWNVPDVSAVLSQPIVSDVPALFFRGDLAPDGNPNWIPTIARGLANVHTVVFPTLGSDLLANGPPCLSALRRAFLANPSATLDTTACERKSPKIQFIAPAK